MYYCEDRQQAGTMSPNSILRRLDAEGIESQRVVEQAELCGMEIKGATIFGEADQWQALRAAFDFNDLIYG